MGAIIAIPTAITLAVLSFRPSDIIYAIKWIISYAYIRITRRLKKRRFNLYDMTAEHDPVKVDFISAPEEIALESPLQEFQLQTRADEVFCYGVNSKSECLIARVARGSNHEAEAWIYLKLSNGKVYQLKETSGFQQSCSEKNAFSCGGLQMHFITPMRVWRIFYNGLLRETNKNTASEKMVHVKFALLWRASSDVFDFTADVNAAALARGMATAKWTEIIPPLEKINRALDFYAQSGIIMGTISIEGDDDEHNIYLFGERLRFMGDTSILKEAGFLHVLGQAHKNGSFIHLSEISVTNIVENLTFGFVVQPTGVVSIITESNVNLDNSFIKKKTKNDESVRFHAGDNLYELKCTSSDEDNHFQSKTSLEGRITVKSLKFDFNSLEGSGFIIKGKNLKFPKRVSSVNPVSPSPSEVPLVTCFSEKRCQDSNVTGGKGSSLGKLTELSQHFQNFIVPNGFVVTTAAYKLFITRDVEKEIKCLEDVLYGKDAGDLKIVCERVKDEIVKSNIPDPVLHSIVYSLQKVFPDKDILKFAVRSSATGEDTEQMSAAGQMDTFLGVTGLREILSAVKKCWASQFSYIAVQYKRQNGQIINTPMAVVVQKMVPCDVAGVLFTCDPLTGNPSIMSITANYGLGESVVSATEEPDTIEIKRDADENLSIKSKTIGAKSQRVVLQDTEGTNSEEVSQKERQTFCLTDEMALRLGSLAVRIEKSYRSQRDIEWGFWNNKLYIFQSRPVTSGSGETDFEIEHEMDAPMRVENEYFTVCNVGEVMPGAMSPLSLDVVLKYIRINFQRSSRTQWHSHVKPRYYPKGITSMYNHVMFLLCDLFENMPEDNEKRKGATIGLFGRVIDDEELFKIISERFEKTKKKWFTGLMPTFGFLRLFRGRKTLKKALKKYENYRIPIEKCKTAQEMFDALLYACSDITDAYDSHMVNTEESTVWNMFILNVLMKSVGELNTDVYKNFAQLLKTSSDVESADVPAAIEQLAFYIAKEKLPEDFKKKDTKDIIGWLEKSETLAGAKYREFLMKHGHRCLREFDLRIKTWGTDPTSLIQLLKNLVGNIKKDPAARKKEGFSGKFSDIGFSLGIKTRLFLRFLIPQCQQSVQNREASKSLAIKTSDAWRKGYHQLAKLMVSEGRIPDEDLLFFMTLDEIKELLDSRTPKIISRANHRRRRYPVMDKYLFPEIMKGFPYPINVDKEVISSDENFCMKGTPVSPGMTKAFVRVALTLDEAESLKAGEILLTYSTDIGWSPYFPMLAGVVTELGGLISHGAVVSREYGLPCIAGLHGATRQFQTGDYVLLDGNKGILQRLPKPENFEYAA